MHDKIFISLRTLQNWFLFTERRSFEDFEVSQVINDEMVKEFNLSHGNVQRRLKEINHV